MHYHIRSSIHWSLRCALLAAAVATAPALDLSQWHLTFDDEFDGNTVDTSKWILGAPWGPEAWQDPQAYIWDDTYVSGGFLHLVGERRLWKSWDYTSGSLSTEGKYAQQYGYFETRARIPAGQGSWPAFWLLQSPTGSLELDVMEILGNDPNTIYMTQHYLGGQHGHGWTGPDFSQDFHTYGMEWNADAVIWYVDGVERFRSTSDIPQVPMNITIMLQVGGDWPGMPDATTPFPLRMDVDYVRAYQPGPPSGGTTTPSAAYGSESVPTTMTAGASYPVSVMMSNTGTSTWTAGAGYKLGSQNPRDNATWGSNRVYLGSGDSIAPGQSTTFSWTVTAPSTPGTYHFQWEMLQENVEWFGAMTPDVVVTVSGAGTGGGLATGFEVGQPQPTWNDTPDWLSHVSGYYGWIRPECSIRMGEVAHGGNTALMYSGTANGDRWTDFVYFKVFDLSQQPLIITSTTTLSYWIYPQYDNGRYVAVDFHFTDGSTLRDSGATDTSGFSLHPAAGHGGQIPLDAWTRIQSDLGSFPHLIGKQVDRVWIAFDRPGASGQFRGYIDDLVVDDVPVATAAVETGTNAAPAGSSHCASGTQITLLPMLGLSLPRNGPHQR